MVSNPRPRARRRPVLALAVGFALLLVLVEAGLWVAHAAKPADRFAMGPMGEGSRTILCIGDSHTYGVHLERAQSYPGQLQALLDRWPESPWRVVNAGYPGQNSAQVRERLAREIEAWRPEIVICWIGMNNSWSFAERQQWDSPEREVRPGVLERWLQTLKTPRLVRMAWNRLSEEQVITPARLRETLRIDWRRMQAICAERGVALLMADYPVHIFEAEQHVNRPLHELAGELGIPIVSVHDEFLPLFYGLGYESTMFGDWHANELGYYAIARRFLHELVALGWLEARPEWLGAEPLWERMAERPIRVVEADHERAVVLLSGPPHARYALRPQVLYTREHDRTRRECLPSSWFAERGAEELGALGYRGALDGEGRARLELELPPTPQIGRDVLRRRGIWLGWRLTLRLGTPEGELQLASGTNAAEVLLDPAVVPPAR